MPLYTVQILTPKSTNPLNTNFFKALPTISTKLCHTLSPYCHATLSLYHSSSRTAVVSSKHSTTYASKSTLFNPLRYNQKRHYPENSNHVLQVSSYKTCSPHQALFKNRPHLLNHREFACVCRILLPACIRAMHCICINLLAQDCLIDMRTAAAPLSHASPYPPKPAM